MSLGYSAAIKLSLRRTLQRSEHYVTKTEALNFAVYFF